MLVVVAAEGAICQEGGLEATDSFSLRSLLRSVRPCVVLGNI